MNKRGKGKDENKEPSMMKNPPWLELPEDIWANILHRLGAIAILLTAEKVCTTWRRICKRPSMWRVIDMWNNGDVDYFDTMCRQAVDRSQGELVVDINMHYFDTDELLSYVADRSGKLKRLSIACCDELCGVWDKVVRKLPLLEELSLTHTYIRKEGIEALGRSCPRLKSFELNNSFYNMVIRFEVDIEDVRNYQALDIAKNLPSLHQLQLIANGMTNKGLQAILDGCPNLVSLDLRLCTNISLEEVLSSRIFQIKDVKHPDDSMEGLGGDEDDAERDSIDMYDDDDDDIIDMYDDDSIDMHGDHISSDDSIIDYY